MRHRPQFDLRLPAGAGESKQDGSSVPKSWKSHRTISEKPADEMARLIRVIAGNANAGEKDEQLRARAARRLGISASRAKVLWYRETENIRADEMDRARSLAFVQPIEEAICALRAARRHIDGELERLLDEATGSRADDPADRRDLPDRRRDFAGGRHSMDRAAIAPPMDGFSLMTLRRLTAE